MDFDGADLTDAVLIGAQVTPFLKVVAHMHVNVGIIRRSWKAVDDAQELHHM